MLPGSGEMRSSELNFLLLLFLAPRRKYLLLDVSKSLEWFFFEYDADEVEDRVRNAGVLDHPDLGDEGLDSSDVAVNFALEPRKQRFSLCANLEGTATVHGHFLLNAVHFLSCLEEL